MGDFRTTREILTIQKKLKYHLPCAPGFEHLR